MTSSLLFFLHQFIPRLCSRNFILIGWSFVLVELWRHNGGTQNIIINIFYSPWRVLYNEPCLNFFIFSTIGDMEVQVFSVFPRWRPNPQLSLCSVPPIFLQVAQDLPATLLWLNCQNQDPLLTFTLSFLFFFPTSGTNSLTLFNPSAPSRYLKQLFTTISYGSPPSPIQNLDLFYPH